MEAFRRLKRSRQIALLAIAAILAGLALAVVPAAFNHQLRKTELKVAFLTRGEADSSQAAFVREQRFEKIHRETIDSLIEDYNKRSSAYRLTRVEESPPPEKGEDRREYRKKRYEELTKVKNLVAVFDNSWGDDIFPIADTIAAFPAPIFFLNADKGGGEFGTARVFLGAADNAPKEIAVLVGKLKKLRGISDQDIIFVNEEDYALGKTFEEAFENAELPATLFAERIQLAKRLPETRTALDQARRGILKSYLKSGGGTFDAMQLRPKLLILNSHSSWGESVISFVSTAMQNVTVIGFQSIISQRADITSYENGNRLIILSNSKHRLRQGLYERYKLLKDKHPQAFERDDAPFYMYRCVAAMDILQVICEQRDWSLMDPTLRRAGQIGTPSLFSSQSLSVSDKIAAEAQHQFRKDFARLLGGRIIGERDSYQLGKDGILVGMNNYISKSSDGASPFGLQLGWVEQPGTEPLMDVRPNVHVGFNKIRISEIDVVTGTFRVDVEYWLRGFRETFAQTLQTPEDGSASKFQWAHNKLPPPTAEAQKEIADPKAPTEVTKTLASDNQKKVFQEKFLIPLNAAVESRDDQQLESAAATVGENLYRICRLSTRVNGAIDGQYYPFDHYRLNLELQAWAQDDTVRLSSADPPPEGMPTAVGWNVKNADVMVNSRDSNPVRIPKNALGNIDQSTQYDVVTVSFNVSRSFTSAVVPVLAPIAFLMVASFSVLFIRLGRGGNAPIRVGNLSASEEQHALETEKMRIELSLGCLLAVVTYLISYASLTPRLYRLLYSDYLMAAALFFCVANFAFVVIGREGRATGIFALTKYRVWMAGLGVLVFLGWIMFGYAHQLAGLQR